MKKLFFLALIVLSFCTTSSAQVKMDTTNIPLKGTYIENGMLKVSKGYKITLSNDKTTATVSRRANGEVTGTYSCVCSGGTGGCVVSSSGGSVRCEGSPGITCIDNCVLVTKNSGGISYIVRIKSN